MTANAGTGPFPVSDNGGSLTVDGAVTATHAADVTSTGLMDAADETVSLTVPPGANSFGIVVTGTMAIGSVITVEGTVDGTNWETLLTQSLGVVGEAAITRITGLYPAFGQSSFMSSCAGMNQVRVRLSTFTAADSVTATLRRTFGRGLCMC